MTKQKSLKTDDRFAEPFGSHLDVLRGLAQG